MYNNTTTEAHITVCDTDITIFQRSPGTPCTTWGAMRYRHPVTIVADGLEATFDYHGNVPDYLAHKDVLSETDLIDALEYTISDAIAGTYDCKEFFAEFGHEDPCEGIKTWRACVKTFEMLNGMGISEDMFYDILNALDDITARSD